MSEDTKPNRKKVIHATFPDKTTGTFSTRVLANAAFPNKINLTESAMRELNRLYPKQEPMVRGGISFELSPFYASDKEASRSYKVERAKVLVSNWMESGELDAGTAKRLRQLLKLLYK